LASAVPHAPAPITAVLVAMVCLGPCLVDLALTSGSSP
jgi:hypothetical protein